MRQGCKIQPIININEIFTLFKISFKDDYDFIGERHDFWEIVFVVDGTVGINADSDVYVIEKGQAVIHRPNEFHRIWSEFSTNPTVIVFSFCSDVFPEFNGRILTLDSSQLKKLDELYTFSNECFLKEGIYITSVQHGKELQAEYFRLNMELLIFSLINKQPFTNESGIRSFEIYNKAVKIMEQYSDAGLCIDDIALRCSISPSYLKKLFIKYAGCSVMQYYNRLRARIACGYLSNGKSVKETSMLLGFSDQNYFSTFFKRVIGRSPTEFKNQGK